MGQKFEWASPSIRASPSVEVPIVLARKSTGSELKRPLLVSNSGFNRFQTALKLQPI